MSRDWIRRCPGWKETLGAGLVSAGVAAATFYLVRIVLARDPLPEPSSGSGVGEPVDPAAVEEGPR